MKFAKVIPFTAHPSFHEKYFETHTEALFYIKALSIQLPEIEHEGQIVELDITVGGMPPQSEDDIDAAGEGLQDNLAHHNIRGVQYRQEGHWHIVTFFGDHPDEGEYDA